MKLYRVEPILPETVTLSSQLEEYEELSDREIGFGEEISCQIVCKGISQAPEILAVELRGGWDKNGIRGNGANN